LRCSAPSLQKLNYPFKWDNALAADFCKNLNAEKVDNLSASIDSLRLSNEQVDIEKINKVLEEVKTIFFESAEHIGILRKNVKRKSSKKGVKKNEPWFDMQCQNLRKKHF